MPPQVSCFVHNSKDIQFPVTEEQTNKNHIYEAGTREL